MVERNKNVYARMKTSLYVKICSTFMIRRTFSTTTASQYMYIAKEGLNLFNIVNIALREKYDVTTLCNRIILMFNSKDS